MLRSSSLHRRVNTPVALTSLDLMANGMISCVGNRTFASGILINNKIKICIMDKNTWIGCNIRQQGPIESINFSTFHYILNKLFISKNLDLPWFVTLSSRIGEKPYHVLFV
jgi:hypothetical protein